ncbi:MAG: SagB/ThcOx family dehydrogenase [Chloroflexi bacterium]|nr:SagB/ThcOx family dehydrogenase [Chloroflexota bacterium]
MKTNSGHEFMVKTCYDNLSPSPQEGGLIPQPPLELPIPAEKSLIALIPHAEIQVPPMDLRDAIETRRTIRKYSQEALSLSEFSYLLWVSQGVKQVSARPSTARTVPSAGARHAFETYVLAKRIDGIAPGLYRYRAIEQGLINLEAEENISQKITAACLDQSQVRTSAVTFIWVAVVERMFWRYMERGYRYLHLDAGHVCQNLALGAEQINCGICPIAAFDDEKLNAVLGLDGENLFVVYLASVGKKE